MIFCQKSITALLSLLALTATAQDRLAHYDMSLSGQKITEQASGNAYDVQSGDLPPFNVDGARGKALRLDGYTNYVAASLPAEKLTQFTLSLWCAAETYPMMNTAEAENTVTYTSIASNLDETAKTGLNVMLSSQGDLKVRFYTEGWGPYELAATAKMPRTEWCHLCLTLNDKRQLTLYNNGEQIGQTSTMGSISMGTAPLYVGKSATELKDGLFNINTFCGLIDDITLYGGVREDVVRDNEPENAPDFVYPASRYEADTYASLWRPAFHAMPSGSWTNETHGMAYSGGRYHLFFQKNANGPYMARLHWGHLSSDDLCNWREENIAFGPSERYDIKGCWSGCVHQEDGRTTAYYTAVDNGKATICSASPADDDLNVWTKDVRNPLVNGRPSGLADDFRDCYVFNANGTKYMIVGTSKDNVGAATLHRLNGTSWTNDGSIFFQGQAKASAGRFFEMPNVTAMGGGDYLLTATPLETGQGVETLYWVGKVNADGTFATTTPIATPGKFELDGFSRDGYGLLSPTICQTDGKTIALGIVPDKLATAYNHRIGWAHNYSLPRELSLDGTTLVQKPFSGLSALRSGATFGMTDETIASAKSLGEVCGRTLEVEAEFTVGDATEFGLRLLGDGSRAAKLFYTPSTGMLTLDLRDLERVSNDDGSFKGLYQSSLPEAPKAGETLRLHVFLDHSILDIFVNDRWAACVRLFPTNAAADKAEVYSVGETTVRSLSAWTLAPGSGTGIAAPSATIANDDTYDLQGRRIGNPKSGLCITGGRKVMR